MPIEAQDIATHTAAGGGGVGLLWLVKFLMKGRERREEKAEEKLDRALEMLSRLDERVKTLQEAVARVADHGREIAVLQAEMSGVKNDLNGLGKLCRATQRQ